jgi:hypothetical protein
LFPTSSKRWQYEKGYDQIATVIVEKTYKGRKRHRLILHQRGKNAPKFTVGSCHLFYANLDRGRKAWGVKECAGSTMVKHAHDDLHYLDGLPASAKQTRIAGEVVLYNPTKENPQGTTERLAGIRFKIIGSEKRYEAVTNASGVYELYGALPGTYILQPEMPLGLTLYGVIQYGFFELAKARSLTIELRTSSCSGASIVLTRIKTR